MYLLNNQKIHFLAYPRLILASAQPCETGDGSYTVSVKRCSYFDSRRTKHFLSSML